jgi:hypothetical protein
MSDKERDFQRQKWNKTTEVRCFCDFWEEDSILEKVSNSESWGREEKKLERKERRGCVIGCSHWSAPSVLVGRKKVGGSRS